MKKLLSSLFLFFLSIPVLAQFPTAQEKAILDLYYRQRTGTVDGADIIASTITTSSLSPTVIIMIVDGSSAWGWIQSNATVFASLTNEWYASTARGITATDSSRWASAYTYSTTNAYVTVTAGTNITAETNVVGRKRDYRINTP